MRELERGRDEVEALGPGVLGEGLGLEVEARGGQLDGARVDVDAEEVVLQELSAAAVLSVERP